MSILSDFLNISLLTGLLRENHLQYLCVFNLFTVFDFSLCLSRIRGDLGDLDERVCVEVFYVLAAGAKVM